jgi:NhaP-type Na+/H+ or K+/H+ antiporter
METRVRTGNIELIRSFFVCLLGAMCLFNAYNPLGPHVCGWGEVAVRGALYLLIGLAGYLVMCHYQRVEDFKNRPYALFLIRAGILCAVAAFLVTVVASQRVC